MLRVSDFILKIGRGLEFSVVKERDELVDVRVAS